MKKTLTTVALSIAGLFSFAQQDVQYSMNTFNRLSVNPAYAGMNKALCATLFYRQQWVSFPGAPKTALLSVDYGQILNGGLGLTIDQDQLGFEKTLKAKVAYSYHLPLKGGILGIGLDAGMIQKSLNGNFIAPDGSSSNGGGGNDQAIPWTGFSATTYDVGFGLYYQTRRLYLGLSSLHLPQQQFKDLGKKYNEARHYYVMAGYTFIMPDPAWEIIPSVLLKSVASSSQLDANLMVKWQKMIFAGVSYRISDSFIGMVGMEKAIDPKKRITAKFGYAYDMTTSNIKKQSNGTHEIMLGFCYKIKPDPSKTSHMNVRFL
jgi:type IX secretion system PorP/SprF family membrane protein